MADRNHHCQYSAPTICVQSDTAFNPTQRGVTRVNAPADSSKSTLLGVSQDYEGDNLRAGEAAPHEESTRLTPGLRAREKRNGGVTGTRASGKARRRRRRDGGGEGGGAAEAAEAAGAGKHIGVSSFGSCGCCALMNLAKESQSRASR
ncbi:uncharacterized protein M421DRAFT_94240 [Didymella exigua CBS 183.55]|uniref:Uncharacterized protein n=1 Tax=Didymella exigua CBS 183.55 TaxID=1150837 RepID=A0A6A5RKP1_9PLEO|nr:uncharacterized protein M421DRAFT_94240 [Didymella exigua CBS 183.55]KAF1926117.1 hypothetical protein M421DRAFT_94240 [Didymella exigua CBS 183.55]